MKFKLSEQAKENIRVITIAGVLIALFCFVCLKITPIFNFVKRIIKILMPFIIGFAIAFILMPLRNIVETKWLSKVSIKDKTKRKIAVVVCIVVLLIVIAAALLLLIPQLVSSIQTLIGNMDTYMATFENFIDRYLSSDEYGPVIENVMNSLTTQVSNWTKELSSLIPKLLNFSVSFVSGILNFFIGLIVSVYILVDEETFRRQLHKAIQAIFPEKTANYIFDVMKLSSKMFNSFIFGKALDSLIIGLICWLVTSIMNIPYSPLISMVVGITNMIPVFGPFIGAIPSIFILLFISPMKALEFGIFIIILQQIDGNIIGPYIIGDSMGLPAFWVMFAIILGGGLFGVVGMFLGVPVFAVLFTLLKELLIERYKAKHIQTE